MPSRFVRCLGCCIASLGQVSSFGPALPALALKRGVHRIFSTKVLHLRIRCPWKEMAPVAAPKLGQARSSLERSDAYPLGCSRCGCTPACPSYRGASRFYFGILFWVQCSPGSEGTHFPGVDVFCFGERSPIAFAGPGVRPSSAMLHAPCGSRPVPCLVRTISAHHRAQSHAVTNCPLAIKRARTIPSPRAPWQAYHGACNI